MYCKNCGANIRDDLKYCPMCGSSMYNPITYNNTHSSEFSKPKSIVSMGMFLGIVIPMFITIIALVLVIVLLINIKSNDPSVATNKDNSYTYEEDIDEGMFEESMNDYPIYGYDSYEEAYSAFTEMMDTRDVETAKRLSADYYIIKGLCNKEVGEDYGWSIYISNCKDVDYWEEEYYPQVKSVVEGNYTIYEEYSFQKLKTIEDEVISDDYGVTASVQSCTVLQSTTYGTSGLVYIYNIDGRWFAMATGVGHTWLDNL